MDGNRTKRLRLGGSGALAVALLFGTALPTIAGDENRGNNPRGDAQLQSVETLAAELEATGNTKPLPPQPPVPMLLPSTAAGGRSQSIGVAGGIQDGGPLILAEPCDLDCPPTAYVEQEPICSDGYVDVFNGGCNSTPAVFEFIEIGLTVCGTSGTYFFEDSNYRDTDWFAVSTTSTTNLIWELEAEFPVLGFIIDAGSGDCVDYTILASGTQDPCTPLSLVAFDIPAGTYWLWAGPSVFVDVPCGADYLGTITAEVVDPCDVIIPPDTYLEQEPICGDNWIDIWNGGCNSEPPVFELVACGMTIAGTSGTYLFEGSNYRDTDWYEVTSPEGTLTWEALAEFPLLLFIMQTNSGDCVDYAILGSATGEPCEPVALSADVVAGTYWLWIGPSVFSGFDCGVEYVATVSCAPFGPPNDNCDGAIPLFDAQVLLNFSTEFATFDGDGGYMSGPNIWYQYSPPIDGMLTISLCGSAYDTRLAVYGGDCSLLGEPIASNDDYAGCQLTSEVHLPVAGGDQLLIEVGGYQQAFGDGWLTIEMDQPPCERNEEPLSRRPLLGDWDGDGDIDLYDVGACWNCFTSAGFLASDACEFIFDMDGDLDVDEDDYSVLAARLAGVWEAQPSGEPLAPICPLDGQTLNTERPNFSWIPCPEPNVIYDFRLWRVPSVPTDPGDIMGTQPPHAQGTTTAPEYYFEDEVPPLLPGETYLWQVNAYDADDPNIVYCSGNAALLDVENATPAQRLAELLAHLEKLRKQLQDAQEDLENNPLVEEVRLMEAIGRILSNLDSLDEDTIAALEAFINCDENALNDLNEETLDGVLGILQGALKLLKTANDDLTQAQKNLIQEIIDKIQEVRDGIADVQTIKEITSGEWDPWAYLGELVTDKIKEVILELAEKVLAKLVGAKAAGPLISIAMDLWNFFDALGDVLTIEDLLRAWNKTMLAAIEAAAETEEYNIPADWQWAQNYIWLNPCEDYEGATIEITPKMYCWQPEEGGEMGEGEWVECSISFSDQGRTSYDETPTAPHEFGPDDMSTETVGEPPNQHTICRYYFSLTWDTDCTPPCYMVVDTKVTKADGTVEEYSFLFGVIAAP
jgi:hypothetical protein